MKFVAVILALVAFSGCHGRMLPQDEAWSGWETMVDSIREYFTDLNTKADRMVQDLQQTQVVRELDTLTQDTMAELALYRDNLRSNLGPYSRERVERLAKDLEALGLTLRTNMGNAGGRAAEYSQELRNVLEQSATDVSATFNSYARKIRKRVNKDTELFNKKIGDYVEELQSRTAENLKVVQSQVEPYLAQVRDNAEAKITTINRLLKTQADDMAGKISSSTDDLREQFDKTAENLRSTLEAKAEELRDWFTSNTAMFRN